MTFQKFLVGFALSWFLTGLAAANDKMKKSAEEIAERTLLTEIPLGTEVRLNADIHFKVYGTSEYLIVYFQDGHWSGFDPKLDGKSPTKIPRFQSLQINRLRSTLAQIGSCTLMDRYSEDYGDVSDPKAKRGHLFTVRGRNYSSDIDPSTKNSDSCLNRGREDRSESFYIYNQDVLNEGGPSPYIACCIGKKGTKVTYGDFKKITGGILTLHIPSP